MIVTVQESFKWVNQKPKILKTITVAQFFKTLCTNAFMRLGGGEKFHWYGYAAYNDAFRQLLQQPP